MEQDRYLKFILELLTALRKVSLYPIKHPSVTTSIKEAHSALTEILASKPSIALSLSQDNKIIVEGESLAGKSAELTNTLAPYFKKLDIENLIFTSGITEDEIASFVLMLALEADKIKNAGGISSVLPDKGITHIKVDQFSYIKVKKDHAGLVLTEGGAPAGKPDIKFRVNNYHAGKVSSPEEVLDIEKELFGFISSEFKEKKKVSASLKSTFKKFVAYAKEKEGVIQRLKGALIEYGCPGPDVDNFVGTISGEASASGKSRRGAKTELLIKENAELKAKLAELSHKVEEGSIHASCLQKQFKKIADEKEKIDTIIHHMADGLVVIGTDGKIMMANPTAQSLLGITNQDINKPLKEAVRDEHLLTLAKNISPESDASVEKDIELLGPNEDTKRVLRTSSAVIEDPNGRTVGMVTILNDVTRQKEVQKMKDDFLASVTHELRTPLIAIEKSVALILNKEAGEVSEPQNQFLTIAQRNLKRLTLLINDLLDLSKLEAGKMSMKKEMISVDRIVKDPVETFKTWADSKGINMDYKINCQNTQINADPNRIIQVLNNLLSNALKFTLSGGSIFVEAHVNTENLLEVSVKDTGVGVSKENLDKIFDKFYQVGQKVHSDSSGTGIGLSIAREIIKMHDGKIWVESQEGKGTKFTFTLNLGG